MMKTFTSFNIYSPETRTLPENVIYLRSVEGEDWYTVQSQFAEDTLKIAYNADGIICSANSDGSMLWPVGQSVSEVKLTDVPTGFNIYGGWVYNGEKITAREYTQEQLVVKAELAKTNILSAINTKTQMWQTQLMLGIITDSDKETLTTWMKYSQAVQTVDASIAPDIIWPAEPTF